MSFANSQGINIYYEVEGQGPPILLAHGMSGNTTYWRGYGYVDHLQEDYTVILYDARGHGQSDKPHEAAAYDHRLMTGDALAVLGALGISKTNCWGYSMGGYTGFALAKNHPEKLISFIGGGTDPAYVPTENAEPSPLLAIFQRGVTEGVDGVVEAMRSAFGSITPAYEVRLRSLDPQAMVAYLEGARTMPSFRNMLSKLDTPCLLYAGELDDGCHEGSELAAQQMPDARYFCLPGLNHASASGAIDLIMPQVLSFLSDINKNA